MAYGTKTSNIMDIPLHVSSVFAPYVGDNGYKFEGSNSIRVLSIDNGTLDDYDESSATEPFGSATLVVPNEQTLELNYNKSMLLRVQNTQIQDIPVSQFSKKVALQQADSVFVPAHDAYSLGKLLAARPSANVVEYDSTDDDIRSKFGRTINKIRTDGADTGKSYAWVGFDFANDLTVAINFTGTDVGYKEGKKGYLGQFKGVKVIEVPDEYLGENVYMIAADKRAIVNVTPKMDPKQGGMTVLDKVPGFSGVEIQLRDRGDTFVLNKKAASVASLEAPSGT